MHIIMQVTQFIHVAGAWQCSRSMYTQFIIVCKSPITGRPLQYTSFSAFNYTQVSCSIACQVREEWEPVVCICQKVSWMKYLRVCFDDSISIYDNVLAYMLKTDAVSAQEHSLKIQSVKPFDINCKLMSTSFQEIEKVVYEQPFILVADVNCTSPWQLSIITSQFEQVRSHTHIHTLKKFCV